MKPQCETAGVWDKMSVKMWLMWVCKVVLALVCEDFLTAFLHTAIALQRVRMNVLQYFRCMASLINAKPRARAYKRNALCMCICMIYEHPKAFAKGVFVCCVETRI